MKIGMLADAKEYTCNDKHTQFIIISKIVPHTHTHTQYTKKKQQQTTRSEGSLGAISDKTVQCIFRIHN